MSTTTVPVPTRLHWLTLAALGVVFGDIGTSPLYAFRMCFLAGGVLQPEPANVLGVLSLIIWALFLVVSLEYLVVVLRADNHGEGGILALMALVREKLPGKSRRRMLIVTCIGLFGAALLYGDGLITPVISVLSAVEGLNAQYPGFKPWVVPVALGILSGLFWMQHRGTATVGALFGPMMLIWFSVLAILGLAWIVREPGILAAFNPLHAVRFCTHNGWHAFITIGAVFLALTGVEALYADMGHFGAKPIRLGWFALVFPALLLNYLGQGALVLSDPGAIDNPFFRLCPAWAVLPMVILATAATVIASQAVISGAFSMTSQAVQLGFLPRLAIIHTSSERMGQIYIPAINWLLCLGTLTLVIGFRQSDRLAGAYGVAVATTMLFTSSMLFFVMRRVWCWPWIATLALGVPFVLVDASFFSSNLLKIREGGWVSLSVAAVAFIVMLTWRRGRELLAVKFGEAMLSDREFLHDVIGAKPLRVPGVAIFLSGQLQGVPRTLLHNFKHNKVIHDTVIFLNITTETIPFVEPADRVNCVHLGHGFHRIRLRYGFRENPNVPAALKHLSLGENQILDPLAATYFLGRETLLIRRQNPPMAAWRCGLFAFLSRNARDASKYFHIPPNRVVEVGIQVEL
jgi:KUP system potassium uptake protein